MKDNKLTLFASIVAAVLGNLDMVEEGQCVTLHCVRSEIVSVSDTPPTTYTNAATSVLETIQNDKTIRKREVTKHTSFEIVPNPFERTGVEALYTIDKSGLPDYVKGKLNKCGATDNDEYHWKAKYAKLRLCSAEM